MDIKNLTIADLRKGLKAGDFSAKDTTEAYLASIEEKNPSINAYLSVFKEGALRTAAETDRRIAGGEEIGALEGVPFGIKDNILVKGEVCTAASKLLKDYRASYDATVISKLKSAGAIVLGKTNLDEFAMGSSTENSAFGVTRNPRDPERVPGGSSGGSAAAVAADMSLAALGSDTGGSIRLPASFCGVVGMKPTYGRVSRFGVMAMASSLDQIGPFAKTVEDAQAVYDVIKGKDKYDATSFSAAESSLRDISGATIGLPEEYYAGGLDGETEKAVQDAIREFESAGAKIKKISLPHSKYALSTYYIIVCAEVSTNLARFDGIRYSRGGTGSDLAEIYFLTRGEGFGEEVKRRILLGTFVLSAGYYDAYYTKAQKVRQLIRADFMNAFNEVDAILAPVSPTLPFKFGEKIGDPMAIYLSDIFTVPVNLAGVPSLAVPVRGREDKLPVGFQLIGKHWHDNDLFELGKYYQRM